MARVSFFKVMNNNFATKLLLPKAFVRKCGHLLPENAKLRTYNGKTWSVGLERTDTENCCYFTRGWAGFVNDAQLDIYEVVRFWFNVQESTFDVAVFGISGVEREIPCHTSSRNEDETADGHDEERPENNEGGTGDDQVMNPAFKILLREHHASRVSLHVQFIRAAKLIGPTAIALKYPPKKRRWAILLDHRPPNRVDLSVGWSDFRKQNNLVYGETYVFEYVREENVIHVKLEH